MKKLHILLFLSLFQSMIFAQTDDVYYDPKKDTRSSPFKYSSPTEESESIEETSGDVNTDKTDGYSDHKALQYDGSGANNSYQLKDGNSHITNNFFLDGDDYYDFFFSSRLRRFYRPTYGLSFWDPFYTNYYYYDWNPWSWGNSIYYGNSFWQPNSWNNGWSTCGWNQWNNGWGGNNWGWNDWNNGWNNGFCGNNFYYNSYYGPVNIYYGNNWNNGWNNGYWQGYLDGSQNYGWSGNPSWYWNQMSDPGYFGPRYVNPGLQMPEGNNSGKNNSNANNVIRTIDQNTVSPNINVTNTNDVRVNVPVSSTIDVNKSNIPKEGYMFEKPTSGSVIQPTSVTSQPGNHVSYPNDKSKQVESSRTLPERTISNGDPTNQNNNRFAPEQRTAPSNIQTPVDRSNSYDRNPTSTPNNNPTQKRDYNNYPERQSAPTQIQPEKRNSSVQPSNNYQRQDMPTNTNPYQQRPQSTPQMIKPQNSIPSSGGSVRPTPIPGGKR